MAPAETQITIYGSSDDTVQVDGCDDAGEFYAGTDDQWQGDLIGPDPAEVMRIRAAFDPDGSGTWVISVSKPDEAIPLPAWGNGIEEAPNGYSTLVRIYAPAGTRLANVDPAPNGSK